MSSANVNGSRLLKVIETAVAGRKAARAHATIPRTRLSLDHVRGRSEGSKRAHEDFAGVAVSQCEAGVGDEVGQALAAAQDTRLGVRVKALVGALHGCLKSKCRSRALLVLHAQVG